MIQIGLDTNILAYLSGVARLEKDQEKVLQIQTLFGSLADSASFFVPTQAFGELYIVLQRIGHSRAKALSIIQDFQRDVETLSISIETFDTALIFATRHQFQIWDALIVMSCEQAGCTLLLSEDMQDGFKVGSTEIANPFATKLNPKLTRLLT
jgi:predicted nucleic acid-binding protein